MRAGNPALVTKQQCLCLDTLPVIHRTFMTSFPRCRQHAAWQLAAYKLKPTSAAEVIIDQACYKVGAAADADLQLKHNQVAEQHAELQQKGKQVFLKALQGESVFDKTYTWIDDQEARPNVSYVLASGSSIAFGDPQLSFIVEFEEPTGSNPLLETMIMGMAATAGDDIKKALE